MFDGKAFGLEIVEVTKAFVQRALAPLLARLEAVEKLLATIAERPPGPADIDSLVAAAVAKALAEQPKMPTADEVAALVPKAVDGKDADQAAVLALVVAEVQKATSGIPMPKDGKDADPEVLAGMITEGIAAVMTPLQGAVDTAIVDVRTVTEAAVAEMKEAIPTAAAVAALVPAGKDADPEVTRAMVAEQVAALPKAADGKSITLDDVRPLVDEVVATKVAEIPPAKDGKDVDLEVVRGLVANEVQVQVAALPAPENGKDTSPEAIDAAVEKHLATWDRPKDGKSVTLEDVLPALQDGLAKAVAALPAAKDGVGLAGALIDSDGILVATLTDGSLHKLGPVRGERGLDGFGFDDITVVDEGLTFTIRFVKGDQVKEFTLAKPTLADMHKGIWREGSYKRGSVVTLGGSQWLALSDTDARPETSKDWTLVVKRGRDGKDGVVTEPKPPKPVKL